MDFFICKVIKFLPQNLWKFFLEKQISLELRKLFSLVFLVWCEMTKVLKALKLLKVWAKLCYFWGLWQIYTALMLFASMVHQKLFLIVQFGNQLRHYRPNKNSFLDISLFFIYSYWYLPLKEWHTTCKKEKKSKKHQRDTSMKLFVATFCPLKKT